jgi:hypothetical protein
MSFPAEEPRTSHSRGPRYACYACLGRSQTLKTAFCAGPPSSAFELPARSQLNC